jgi:hypothetical protein
MSRSSNPASGAALLAVALLMLGAAAVPACTSDPECENGDTCSVPDTCQAGACVAGGGGDTDDDGTCDLDDPVDAPLTLTSLRAKQDESTVVDNGRINVKGLLPTNPPGDVLDLQSLTVRITDGLALDRTVTAPCVAGSGNRFKCTGTTTVPRFKVSLKASAQTPALYRFTLKWSRLALSGPFLEPLTVRFSDDDGPTDRVGTIVECIKTNAKITCRE